VGVPSSCHAKVKREREGPDGAWGSMGKGPGASGRGDQRAAQDRHHRRERRATEGGEGDADRWTQVYLKINLIPNLIQL
jgi:hypothetical protein